MKKTPVYRLLAENLTSVGGPMGSDTYELPYFDEFYYSIEAAKKRAETHYSTEYGNGPRVKIKWKREKGGLTSGDLHFVEYTITQIVIK